MRKQVRKNLSVYAFIDSQNLYLGVKNQGWKLDYAVFLDEVKEKIKEGHYPSDEP